LWIKEYLFIGHRKVSFPHSRSRGDGLRYTVRIVWKLTA
jgi:hypothetical protein